MLEGKKIMIFDLDGTLIDSIGIWNLIDRQLIQRPVALETIQQERDAYLYHHREEGYIGYCAYLKETYHLKETPASLHKKRYALAHDYLANHVDYKPHAQDLLKYLKEKGFILVMATTTKRGNIDIYRYENRRLRSKANFDDFFDKIYTREDAERLKPDPEIYLKVLKDYKVKPCQCFAFEDSWIGFQASKSAGIDTIVIADEHAQEERASLKEQAFFYAKDYLSLLKKFKQND